MSVLMMKANICMNDSVLDMMHVMMSEKVCVLFNQFGFCPFKSEPILVIEYEHCSKEQLALKHGSELDVWAQSFTRDLSQGAQCVPVGGLDLVCVHGLRRTGWRGCEGRTVHLIMTALPK